MTARLKVYRSPIQEDTFHSPHRTSLIESILSAFLFYHRRQHPEGGGGEPVEAGHQLHVPAGGHGPAGHVLLPHEGGGGAEGMSRAPGLLAICSCVVSIIEILYT